MVSLCDPHFRRVDFVVRDWIVDVLYLFVVWPVQGLWKLARGVVMLATLAGIGFAMGFIGYACVSLNG